MAKIIWKTSAVSTPTLKLTSVAVKRESNAVTVFIQGKGLFKYQIVPVDVLRFVLDFPGAISLLSFRTLGVGHAILRQIRIGQHEKKLRLVFDLAQRADHAIKKGREVLAVQFTS